MKSTLLASPPEWELKVSQHLLWAVHTAAQNVPDTADRNRTVVRLLDEILARW